MTAARISSLVSPYHYITTRMRQLFCVEVEHRICIADLVTSRSYKAGL